MSERKQLIIKYQKTKYSKLNAAKRCEGWDNFLKVLSFTYNISLCVFAILSIVLSINWLSLVTALLSIVVFATSLFCSSLNFSGKTKEHRKTMAEVDKIIARLNNTDDEDADTIHSASAEYDLLMSSCLQHEEIDYISYKHEYPLDFKPEKSADPEKQKDNEIQYNREISEAHKKYYSYKVKIFLFKTIITAFIYPIFIIIHRLFSFIYRSFKMKH